MRTQPADQTQKLIQKAVRERESRRSGKSRVVAILVLLALIGFGLVMIFAVYPGHPGDAWAPNCNAQTMSTGDVCDEFVNGVLTHTHSYQDMVHQQQASHPIALVVGIIAIAIVALVFAPVLRALDPARSWGMARPEACPRCHQPSLREKQMCHIETRGRVSTTWRGIVTLCTPDCGYATVRKP